MKNSIYCLYNVLSQRYGDVVCFPSDAYAVQRLRESLKPEQLIELELCNLGYVDIESGILETHAPIRIPIPEELSPVPIDDYEK
ncbi:hypothetical protein [Tortoise microvirus 10]|nr:hypothetical protein [Tortoise microvirus 10]QCS37002.1 hypothetical protein [Tortoise microvirus 10]